MRSDALRKDCGVGAGRTWLLAEYASVAASNAQKYLRRVAAIISRDCNYLRAESNLITNVIRAAGEERFARVAPKPFLPNGKIH